MKKAIFAVSFILILFLSTFIYLSLDFPANIIKNVPGPAVFPQIVAFILFILICLLCIENYKTTEDTPIFDFKSEGMKRIFLVLINTVIYCLLLPTVGFIILTPICLFSLMMIMERGAIVKKIISSLVTTAIIYISFQVLLDVPLPQALM